MRGGVVTQRGAATFEAKAAVLRAVRTVRDATQGGVRRWDAGTELADAPILARTHGELWSNAGDLWHQLGKVQNLRVAARRLDGIEIPAGAIFSFWAQVGRPARNEGYTVGRELREGCLVPSVGGGICQLSNALYQVALRAGFEIVERHAHSAQVPGSAAIAGQDATVFWNYVDLRFRAGHAFRLDVSLTEAELVVAVRGIAASTVATPATKDVIKIDALVDAEADDCASCGKAACARHAPLLQGQECETAILVDGYWPEFDAAFALAKRAKTSLYLPVDGRRLGARRYSWSTDAMARVVAAPFATARRAVRSRRLGAQGAKRQRALIEDEARLARSYARRLDPAVTHLVVQQGLLPELFRNGDLGGRRYSVFADRLPIRCVHERLDLLGAAHPESPTAADFRASQEAADLEWRALERAVRILTPHAEIAALFPEKTELLPWSAPPLRFCRRSEKSGRPRILFPAATVARKGVYELRSAIAGLDCELLLFAGDFEDEKFWGEREVRVVETRELADEPLDVVVLPAWIESQPRVLLAALACGVPVIASTACGLTPRADLSLIPIGSVSALADRLAKSIGYAG